MRIVSLVMITVSVTLLSLYFYADKEALGSSKSELDVPVLPITQLEGTYKSSTVNAQNAQEQQALKGFQLYQGIKEHFDAFILQHADKNIEELVKAYNDFLSTENYRVRAHQYAIDLFSRYLHYKSSLQKIDESTETAELINTSEQLTTIQFRLQELQRIRSEYFTPEEYQHLFLDDEKFDASALARLQIVSDGRLTKAQKKKLLSQHFDNLGERQKQGFTASLEVENLQKLANQSNGSNKYNSIAAEFGDSVAQRYIERQKAQQSWQSKVLEYIARQQALQQNQNLSDHEKQEEIAQLRNQLFSAREQRRLNVYLENPSLVDDSG